MTTPSGDIALDYLRGLRSDVLFKATGLPEPELRRPMTGTGTNVLGLVKHLAACEWGYFQISFGRPWPPLPNLAEGADPMLDMYATEDETPESVLDGYRAATAAADATVAALGLDAVGRIPWWGDREVPIRRIIVHMAVETARHLGHLDVVREQLDGRIGLSEGTTNLPSEDPDYWSRHVENLQRIAKLAEAGALPHQRRDA